MRETARAVSTKARDTDRERLADTESAGEERLLLDNGLCRRPDDPRCVQTGG